MLISLFAFGVSDKGPRSLIRCEEGSGADVLSDRKFAKMQTNTIHPFLMGGSFAKNIAPWREKFSESPPSSFVSSGSPPRAPKSFRRIRFMSRDHESLKKQPRGWF